MRNLLTGALTLLFTDTQGDAFFVVFARATDAVALRTRASQVARK